ncbi:hypothetical protein DPMN_083684 [Dreissena polymorpha]|uniref:Uncharacterized protein n=1 Tax=Dreissena polymorpha TaxID=45954 RepID=A0A9D4BIP8_DREPO|nr:hypothetical protein DPMN_083684 [Dreissena polymorpha]
MEGIKYPMDKITLENQTHAKSNCFRPMFVKRSMTDLTCLSRKRHVIVERGDMRQFSRANNVPVVSVQYDVPKMPSSPLIYRIRRLNTPISGLGRSKSEENIRVNSKYICSLKNYSVISSLNMSDYYND